MAKRRPTPKDATDAVREAVDRTVQATVGSARDRAQDAVDEIVKGAEARATEVRQRVRGAIAESRPATHDDLREIRTELRAIARRLDTIEERLPARRRTSARKQTAAGSRRKSGGAKRGAGRGRSSR